VLREKEFILKSTPSPKQVMVIGGGLAGMEAARVLAERGHRVSLYERGENLGGHSGTSPHGSSERKASPVW
jgi:2-enoate reductase